MVARLVECTDYDVTYGILTVDNVSADEVQKKIYEIKQKFLSEGFDDWTVEDVLMQLPWEFSYEQNTDILEI
jgi:hypothetical protein